MPASPGFTFGPYQLDLRSGRLFRGGDEVTLPSQQLELLTALVRNAGVLLSNVQLIRAAWGDVEVSDKNLAQAVSQLGATLDRENPEHFISTARGRGYRFVAPVEPIAAALMDGELDAMLAPYRALLDGRAALETLARDEIARARATFKDLVARHSREAAFHVGYANACVLQYESTRVDPAPDVEALRLAAIHAREACRLNAGSSEAWATLGFVLERTGDRLDALAALRRSVSLDPDNWRHQLRLSLGSWGEERFGATRLALALSEGNPVAHWLAATVFVARGSLTAAEREVDAGLAALPSEPNASTRLPCVALYWLKGLLCLARGADDEALAAFEQELACEGRGHLYAREIAANTWYAIGACRLARREHDAARAGFEQAIRRVPWHPMANAGLAAMGEGPPVTARRAPMELALARAGALAASGDSAGAARVVSTALESSPPGSVAWFVPIDPLLGVVRDRPTWSNVLATLRARAD